MLRRAENCEATFHYSRFSTRGRVTFRIGRKEHRLPQKTNLEDFRATVEQQRSYPVFVARIGDRNYWQFQGSFYWDNDGLTAEQIHALLVTRQQREHARIERAQAMIEEDQDVLDMYPLLSDLDPENG